MRLFASHAGIEHFRVEWNNKPLLLFADMEAKEYSSAWSYQNAKAVITTGQNVTMGLKKGNTVLLRFQFHGQLYQAILQMSSSVFFFALCCLGKIPGGAPFSQLHKGGNGSRVDRP